MDNNFQQNQNNNDFYNNNMSPPPQQWGAPQQPAYADNRMRMQENTQKSPLIPILVGCIIVLLIAICLIGGYLFGKSRNKDRGGTNVPVAAVQTSAEQTMPVTETAAAEIVTEAVTETERAEVIIETVTTTAPVQTTVVVSVQVVTEAPKAIFVGDYAGEVRVATKSTDLNMRDAPTTSAKIIGSIPKDTIVSYYYGGEGSWGIVYYNGKFGYVNTSYISFDLYPSGNYGQYGGSNSVAVVNASGGLNLRSSESTSASIVTLIPNGTEITVYSSYDGWSYVSYGSNYGYVKSEYLKFK